MALNTTDSTAGLTGSTIVIATLSSLCFVAHAEPFMSSTPQLDVKYSVSSSPISYGVAAPASLGTLHTFGQKASSVDDMVRNDISVNQLLAINSSIDLDAISAIVKRSLTVLSVSGRTPTYDLRLGDDENDSPMLFIGINTHGMDLEEQMERERKIRDYISSREQLTDAKKYIALSVF